MRGAVLPVFVSCIGFLVMPLPRWPFLRLLARLLRISWGGGVLGGGGVLVFEAGWKATISGVIVTPRGHVAETPFREVRCDSGGYVLSIRPRSALG